jgi:hypothetical protein
MENETITNQLEGRGVTKTAIGWIIFLCGPLAFTIWDRMFAHFRHAQAPALECLEPRTWVLLGVLALASMWGTSALRGAWGSVLRIGLVVGQVWIALAIQFFVLEPAQAELGHYAAHTCGDL